MPVAWVEVEALLEALEGAVPGFSFLNRGALESALEAPRNHSHYQGSRDIFELAAIYAHRVAKAHALSDGNKRAAHAASQLFLMSNGIMLMLDVETVTALVTGLAAGDVSEYEFAHYLRHCKCL